MSKPSLRDAGAVFGRDHATCLHSIKVIDNLRSTYREEGAKYNKTTIALKNYILNKQNADEVFREEQLFRKQERNGARFFL
jgi:hypothetical protein